MNAELGIVVQRGCGLPQESGIKESSEQGHALTGALHSDNS